MFLYQLVKNNCEKINWKKLLVFKLLHYKVHYNIGVLRITAHLMEKSEFIGQSYSFKVIVN